MFNFVYFIHVDQLDVLGFTSEYRYVIMILFSNMILYYLSKPIFRWLIRGRFEVFLTYLITSLLLLTTISILTIYHNNWMIMNMGLLAIMFFGSFLALHTLFHLLKFVLKRKKINRLQKI